MASPSLAHPFYVVPVRAVLQMDGLRPHEEVREQLIEWQEGMEVVFFSHTWLAQSVIVRPNEEARRIKIA